MMCEMFFCSVVALCDLVHDVKSICHLCLLLLNSIRKFISEIGVMTEKP